MRMEEGFCILDLPSLLPDESSLKRRTADILGILEARSDGRPGQIEALKDGGGVRKLAKGYLDGGEDRLRTLAAETADVNAEVAVFAIFNSLKGAILATAASLQGIDAEGWKRKICPVCGGSPAAAFLSGEGGGRHLICHRCHFRWRVARLFCTSCENTDHVSLGYFTIEGHESGPRVDYCQKCSGYIKTWDIREREELLPEAEDLKTPSVDLAAQNEGYFRSGPNIFGVVTAWPAEFLPGGWKKR